MAHIFIGNQQMVDRDVLNTLARLPDDFWVYGEFDCNRRNIDWLVIRAVPDDRPLHRHSTVILTELKRTEAQLGGGEYGRWTETRNGLTHDIVPGNAQDENYWRQLINTVNQLRSWMFANQPRFMDPDGLLPSEQELKIWPNLLIVSPTDIQHRLPLVPVNRFGAFHYQLNEWFEKLVAWSPREGLRVTAAEAERLGAVLGLQLVSTERVSDHREPDPTPVPAPFPPPLAAPAHPASEPPTSSGEFAWLDGFWDASETFARAASVYGKSADAFAEWASQVETRLSRIERQMNIQTRGNLDATPASPAGREPSGAPGEAMPAGPAGVAPQRVLTPEIASLINQAISNVRTSRRRRDFPTLGQEMLYLAGPRLRESQYFGFGNLRALMDEAVENGMVVYGPIDGNAPSIYLPSEYGS